MSHSFDFMDLNEKLFLLRHLASGAKEFCKEEQLVEGPIDHEEDWTIYHLRMRFFVSSRLIELAANLRIVEDTCKHQDTYTDIRDLDALCRENKQIGIVHQGSFELTLRESFNKIIHATEFGILITTNEGSQPQSRFSYWNGHCVLRGTHSGKEWHLKINVREWCRAIDDFVDELSRNVDY